MPPSTPNRERSQHPLADTDQGLEGNIAPRDSRKEGDNIRNKID